MHWRYLKYLVRHKWFVFVAGRRTGAPLWRLIIHDWSKFMPCEWCPYAEFFYGNHYDDSGPDGIFPDWYQRKQSKRQNNFDRAWLHHQHLNPHHWQHWVLQEDIPSDPSGRPKILQIPEHFAREMVADWMGAGRAITGKWDVALWYERNREHIMLHPRTRQLVEGLVGGERRGYEALSIGSAR